MNNEEFIHSYLNGQLGEAEKERLRNLFEIDASFKEEWLFQTDMRMVFLELEREQLREKIKAFEFVSQRRKLMQTWLIAASVLLLLGVVTFPFFNYKTSTNKIYASYFEPYKNVVQPMMRGKTSTTLDAEAFSSYEISNYQKALLGFQKLYKTTGKTYYLLYEANALMANGKIKRAIPLLQKQLSFQDAFAEKSSWYLALAYLKTHQITKAKRLFEKIVSQKSFKAEESQLILKELE